MDKYKNKYRPSSTRIQSWDYGWDAAYFITICTFKRNCYFGSVVNGEMRLSNIGVLADVFWHEIKNHAKNTELDAFVVMPNHVHGIIILNGNDTINGNIDGNADGSNDGSVSVVDTRHALYLQPHRPHTTIGQKRFQNQGRNTLSSIIGSYKSAVTKHARRLGYDFAWQSRFYDHIIRDNGSYKRIYQYIINNPCSWDNDK